MGQGSWGALAAAGELAVRTGRLRGPEAGPLSPSALSHGDTLKSYLQSTFWPFWGTRFLLKGRKVLLFLCPALPCQIGCPPPSARPSYLLAPDLLLQRQPFDFPSISRPAKKFTHPHTLFITLTTLRPAWGSTWPSSFFSELPFPSFPPTSPSQLLP